MKTYFDWYLGASEKGNSNFFTGNQFLKLLETISKFKIATDAGSGFPFAPPCFSQRASQVSVVVKNPSANAGDIRYLGSIPGSGSSRGGGRGNPLQYSYLENPMDRGPW